MRVVTAGSEGAADESTPDYPHRTSLYNDYVLPCAYNQSVLPENALCARANPEQTAQNEHASCRNPGNRGNGIVKPHNSRMLEGFTSSIQTANAKKVGLPLDGTPVSVG